MYDKEQLVSIKIIANNYITRYYEDKGYKIPKHNYKGAIRIAKGTVIEVRAKDLMPGSGHYIDVYCELCGKEGKERIYNADRLCNGCTTTKANNPGLLGYSADERTKYYNARNNSKRMKREFSIDAKRFMELWTEGECYYCGNDKGTIPHANNRNRSLKKLITLGVDRLDPLIGYTNENCVTCCHICNVAKSTLEVNEYIEHCRSVVKYIDGKEL